MAIKINAKCLAFSERQFCPASAALQECAPAAALALPFWEAAANYFCAHPEYDGLIYFTDGYAPPPTFNTKRPIDVLWVLTSKREYERSKDWISKLPRNRATYVPQGGG